MQLSYCQFWELLSHLKLILIGIEQIDFPLAQQNGLSVVLQHLLCTSQKWILCLNGTTVL